MKLIAACVVLLLAAPLAAQSRVYTNADLGKPVTPRPDAAAAAQILAPYQFVAVPRVRGGPTFVVFGSPTAGPFGEFAPFDPPRRLDGTRYTDRPWRSTTFLPFPAVSGWPVVSTRGDRTRPRAGR